MSLKPSKKEEEYIARLEFEAQKREKKSVRNNCLLKKKSA